MLNIIRNTILIILLNLCIKSVHAQAQFPSESDSLPLDSSIRYGRLPNGFTYFIKSIPEIQSKLHLRLYNKAGSNQEDSNQLELSHAVEHLAFKATTNFPLGIRNNEHLLKMDLGMYDYSANINKRHAEYYFDAPQGNHQAFNFGLLWFKDIINGLKLHEKDIDQVRGELRQETLIRSGDDLITLSTVDRLQAQLFPCAQNPSNVLEFYKKFTIKDLNRYYTDWYRPDSMGLSIVGNIADITEIEELIKERFSEIRSPVDPRKLKDCDALYFNQPSQFIKVIRPPDSSKVLQNNEIYFRLFFRDPETQKNLYNMKGRKRLILMQLLVSHINKRLRQTTDGYQSFHQGSRYLYELKALPPSLEILTESSSGNEKKTLRKVIHSIHQIQKYGILEEEWKDIKEEQLNLLYSIDDSKANYWIKEIERYYVYGEVLPSNKLENLRKWLNNYSLEEFNDFSSQFLREMPEDIAIIAPAGNKALSYDEEEVRSWIENVYNKKVQPFKPIAKLSGLMKPEELKKLRKKKYQDKETGPSGAREVVFDNGVKVVLKSSVASGNQKSIKIHGFSRNGANCFLKDNYYASINAPAIVKHSGVNGLDKFQMDDFLSASGIFPGDIFPYISENESGIQTETNIEDLHLVLQLIYLYFTSPNKNKVAFEDWKIREYKAFQNPSYHLPDNDFRNAIMEFLGEKPSSNILGRKHTMGTTRFEGTLNTDLDKAMESYEAIFTRSKDFTFLISGDFEAEKILPLIQKYLGNLPVLDSRLQCCAVRSKSKRLENGPVRYEFEAPEYYQMRNISYGVRFIQESENPSDWKEQLKVEALGGVTNHKVWGLRHDKGYSLYLVGVSARLNLDMNRYEIASTFHCVPKEFPMIRKEFRQIIAEIKAGSISEGDFQQGLLRMNMLYNAKRSNLPRVLNQNLFTHFRYNQPWLDPEEVEEYVKSITVQDIVETAKKYYTEENFHEFIMRDKRGFSSE